jgi:hypothetical protein
MKNLLTILFTLITLASFAQNNTNSTIIAYPSIAQAIKSPKKVGFHFDVMENGKPSHWVIALRSQGYVPDSAMVWAMADTNRVAVRDISQSQAVNVEWFGLVGDGHTDNYNQFQRLARWVNARGGNVTINFNPGVYIIDTFKAADPDLKTIILTHDSTIIVPDDDGNPTAGDTIVGDVGDTLLVASTHYHATTIDDIIYRDVSNVSFVGNGATISVKGNFNREWTHSTASGRTHMSAYGTVCPFLIAGGTNITITGFTLDGNVDQMTRDVGVNEGWAYGILARGVENLTLNNLFVYHFASDGIYIEGRGAPIYKASRYVTGTNLIVRYCGRQGLTIGGLYHGTFTSCDFSGIGDSLGTYLTGHAPMKGLDIEPIFEQSGPPNTLIRTDRKTTDISFVNCSFDDNVGGSIALSHPYTVENITFKECRFDNRKFNHFYYIISTINGLTLENCTMYQGTGGMYLTRSAGGLQRVTVKNNMIFAGGQFVLSGSAAQYGVIVEGNYIKGVHDTSYKYYFPYLSSAANYTNNTFEIDSNLYKGTGQNRSAYIGTGVIMDGNTWLSQIDTSKGLGTYTIPYANVKYAVHEKYSAKWAMKPNGTWDVVKYPVFSTGTIGIGTGQRVNIGSGKTMGVYYLPSLPTTGLYNEGDIIWMTKPLTAGYSLYRCTVGGDAALSTAIFVPVGAISSTGVMVYHNAHVVTASDDYIGRSLDSGATSKVATALLPNGGVYLTKAANDTGIIAFKSPFTFGALLADIIIEGSIFVRGKGSAAFTVSAKTNGNFTFTNPSLTVRNDSNLVTTKVRWLKDASNAYYLGFNDTNTVNTDKTVISLDKITITSATNANLTNATTAWTPLLIKSLTGFTATNMNNTAITLVANGGTGNTNAGFTANRLNYYDGNKIASSSAQWSEANGTLTVPNNDGNGGLIVKRTVGANTGELDIGQSSGRGIVAKNNGVSANLDITANQTNFNSHLLIAAQKAVAVYQLR